MNLIINVQGYYSYHCEIDNQFKDISSKEAVSYVIFMHTYQTTDCKITVYINPDVYTAIFQYNKINFKSNSNDFLVTSINTQKQESIEKQNARVLKNKMKVINESF